MADDKTTDKPPTPPVTGQSPRQGDEGETKRQGDEAVSLTSPAGAKVRTKGETADRLRRQGWS